MRYYNQTNYPHVPYPTLTDLPELGRSDTTVRDAGCGLCASCMEHGDSLSDYSISFYYSPLPHYIISFSFTKYDFKVIILVIRILPTGISS